MWPNEEETCQLLESARQGDAAAVNRLLDKHRDSLRRMVEARVYGGMARRVDASDVVQDALVEASRRLSDYLKDPRMPFHAWLRALAHDRLVDAFRRHGAEKRDVGRDQSLGGGEDSSDRPRREIADRELTPAAQRCGKSFKPASPRLSGSCPTRPATSC